MMDTVRTLLLAAACLTALATSEPPAPAEPDIGNAQQLNVSLASVLNLSAVNSRSTPTDCSSLPANSVSGVYVVQPVGGPNLMVYCVIKGRDRWTVIQRNSATTTLAWDQTWAAYKTGFGSLSGDHWLGNEYIHLLTAQRTYKVRFALVDSSGRESVADYDTFRVEAEGQGYALRLGQHSGSAANRLQVGSTSGLQDNMKFSTRDRDQDLTSSNCASSHGGGFWFNSCYSAHLNRCGALYWDGNVQASTIMIAPTDICH
nr:PREDICTED: fibrinogen-like protein 1-like protein [Lepisosteus oculatus]XP_015195212.1 PREDICTED: fibrinogen-like protein 1-like protein [Lepisosteus oculatus]